MSKHKKQLAINKKLLPLVIVVMSIFAATLIITHPNPTGKKAEQLVACTGDTATNFDCWTKYYQYIVTNESVEKAFEDLKVQYASSTYLQSQCHQVTHVIGRAEIDKENITVGEAYQKGDSFCWSGYYHGVIEQVAKTMGRGEFMSQLNTLCSEVESQERYSFNHYNCVHGLGHGVMALYDNELFDSLSSCDAITDSWNRSSCYGGVFMENIMSDPAVNPTHGTKYLNSDEPMYPCTAVEEQYKEQCYLMQTSYALRQISYNFSKVFELCAEVKQPYQNICYQSVGRDASGSTVSDLASTKINCELGSTQEQEAQCAVGAVKDFISYYSDDVKAKQLCESFADAYVREVCNVTATSYYRSF